MTTGTRSLDRLLRGRAGVAAAVLALLAGVLVPARVAVVASSAAPSVIVNTTTDDPDATPGDGVCDTGTVNGDGEPGCSLRAALETVNDSAVDTVVFSVPTSEPGVVDGIVTIAPIGALPVLSAPIVLDGSTQPGFAGDPIVAIDGSAAAEDLLDLTSGSSTIRSLVLHDAPDEAINIRDGGGTQVLGTWIGVLPDGVTVAAGADDAIAVRAGAHGTVIGSLAPGEGNLLAGAGGDGVYVLADDVAIAGTRIGVLADGSPGSVVRDGIRVEGAARTTVREVVVAHVGGAGVNVVGAATEASVLGSSLHDNGGLGIDLGDDGLTANDPGDADSGPNGLLNAPVLTRTTPTSVTFELDQAAGDVRVEVFANPGGADPSGAGEGEVLVGSVTVSHPGGVATHSIGGLSGLSSDDAVSLTATRDLGGSFGATSEFSTAALSDDHVAVVNDTGDAGDASPGDGDCDTGETNVDGDPACTLRAAIEESNATPAVDHIHFAVPTGDPGHDPAAGVWTIGVGTELPAVTGAVVVDGTTQPGAASNPLLGSADPVGVSGAPLAQVRLPAIALDDASDAGPETGLEIAGDGVTVRGLTISRFPDAVGGGHANLVLTGTDVQVEGVVLGADPADPSAVPAAGPHTVGDNVLLGAAGSGAIRNSLLLWAGGAAVRSAGPLTGTWTLADLDVAGHGATPAVAPAVTPATVELDGGTGHRIQHVRVRGNVGVGISDGLGATDLRVQESSVTGNGGHGLLLAGNVSGVTTTVVSGNAGDGFRLAPSTVDVALHGNAVSANGGLGIDLGGDGVTPNDPLDVDTGANGLHNAPVFTRTTPGGVTVELDVAAGDVLVEVFGNPTEGADPTGVGEGETLLLATILTHPGGGSVAYDLTVPGLTFGDVLSATASRVVAGVPVETSEFSAAALVADPALDTGAGERVIVDSAGGGRHGRPHGSMTSEDLVPGRIGGAIDLDGIDDRVVVHNLDVRGDTLTLSAWVDLDELGGDPVVLAKSLGLGAADVRWQLATGVAGGPDARLTATVATTAGPAIASGPDDVAVGDGWVHLAATYDGARISLWRDGALVATAPHTGALQPDPDVPLVLGAASAAGDRPFDGRLDEVRVSDVARSAAWIAAEHATQSDPAAAITVGEVQTAPSEGWVETTDQARSGSRSVAAPTDVFSAWLTRDGLDEVGLEVTAWWRVNSLTDVDLGQGVRAGDAGGAAGIRQDEVGLSEPAGFDLGQVEGARTRIVAPPAGQTPSVDAWQEVTVRIDQDGALSATAGGVDVPGIGTAPGGVAASGGLGWRVGRLDGLSRWWVDDLRVRRLVTPEPTTTVQRRELAP